MIIERRYVGPPDSGNGGWSAARFAAAVGGEPVDGEAIGGDAAGSGGGAVEVTLRRPVPVETPLTAVGGEIHDPAGLVVAEVRPAVEPPPVVEPVDPAVARAASAAYPGLLHHPFPGCYVCGPAHPDGLRIYPGRLPDGRTAAPFLVPADVSVATVWAALDCPGGWTVLGPGRPYVLGRITARVTALPRPGDECVVTGRAGDVAGRKAQVYSSLYGPTGTLLGHARATWIALPAG
ncbi:hypothetical protein E1091_03505 [Micromonospora fluostatini]|uniref:Thioesterase family protein n=1 Tax=Micromonospora fluostatini TaxID=1629071 RepID=A0ABY2DMW2_9ACTN|nr:hypothetical protein E1091_03505 [Micromonospora fluostatini]